MSDDEQGYNGWKNYPTWAVNLWLSNDESLSRRTLEIVQDGACIPDDIRAFVTDDLTPDLGATLAADLLGYALAEVDWHEIATKYPAA